MQEIYELLENLANLETTILITGESGTGKELVAKALHYAGQRAQQPFVTPGAGYSTVFTADNYALPTGNFLAAPYNDVPLMVGMAGEDMELIFRGTKLYLPMIKQNSPIYAFVFNQVPDGWKALGVGAWHGSEVASQFGNVGMGLGMFLGALLPADLPLDPGVTFKDEWVSEYMTSMLAKFAESGNPGGVMKIKWPAFDHRDQYLDIGYKPIVKTGFTQLAYPVMPR
jgi:hypothetical protein